MQKEDDQSAISLSRASEILKQVWSKGTVSGRRPKFFYFQLLDAFRLGTMTRNLAVSGLNDEVYTAEAIEVLVRRLVEQAIVVSYVGKQEGTEIIDSFLKTSARQFIKSWKEEHETNDKDLSVIELPDYRQMAEATNKNLYDLYQRLSYLAHPRGALSYSLVENENQQERGIDRKEFYKRRCENALIELASCINLICDVFEKEDLLWQNR